jgi:hypothetical protein
MPKTQPPSYLAGVEPVPCIATDAEIALAERLRHQIEERYFGRASTPTSTRAQPSNDDRFDGPDELLSGSSR